MQDVLQGMAAAVEPAGAVTPVAETPTLDWLSQGANRAEELRGELRQGGQDVLDLVTEFRFDPTVPRSEMPEPRNLGANDRIETLVSEYTGAPAAGAPGEDRMQATMTLVQDIYLATAKTLVAWKVLDGVGKDTKTMLQTQ